MKEFFKIMGKYFRPYKRFVIGTFSFNILTAVFNVFSFTLLLPILNILFGIETETYRFIEWGTGNLKDTAINNLYYYSQTLVNTYGPSTTLLMLGFGLALMTVSYTHLRAHET